MEELDDYNNIDPEKNRVILWRMFKKLLPVLILLAIALRFMYYAPKYLKEQTIELLMQDSSAVRINDSVYLKLYDLNSDVDNDSDSTMTK